LPPDAAAAAAEAAAAAAITTGSVAPNVRGPVCMTAGAKTTSRGCPPNTDWSRAAVVRGRKRKKAIEAKDEDSQKLESRKDVSKMSKFGSNTCLENESDQV
jgi:hypothetical protein